MTGIVETDLGLELVCEKVIAADGSLAPSLHAIYLRHSGAAAWTDAAWIDCWPNCCATT